MGINFKGLSLQRIAIQTSQLLIQHTFFGRLIFAKLKWLHYFLEENLQNFCRFRGNVLINKYRKFATSTKPFYEMLFYMNQIAAEVFQVKDFVKRRFDLMQVFLVLNERKP